jgi:hypothetical protein
MWAAQHYGVHAVGITLSQNQHDYVHEQVKARGLEGRVEVRLMDYRDIPTDMQFDKIASVGMFEHVGRGNLDGYFDKIFSLLKPGGLVMNHGITAAGLDTDGLGSGISEFIDDYVFSGGELVHAARVIESLARSGLEPGCGKLAPPLCAHPVAMGIPAGSAQQRGAAPDRRAEIPYLAHLHGRLCPRVRSRLDGAVSDTGREAPCQRQFAVPVYPRSCL